MDLPSDFPDESYPGFMAPIVVKSHLTSRVASGLAKFGLIPAWAKDGKIARHTYNARSETAAEKPSYRTAWRHRQYGLVLVDNFYEPSYESGRAVRWKIELASGDPFGIACLWDRWTDPASGELMVSFSMLTVNADEHPVMRQFHKSGDEKRMAAVATFLPCYLITIVSAPHFKKWGKNPSVIAFVDGITAAAIGAIAGSVVVIAQRSISDIPTALLAVGATALLWKFKKIHEPVLVIGAALIGLAVYPLLSH